MEDIEKREKSDWQSFIDEDISKLTVSCLHTHLFCHAIHACKDIKEELTSQNGKLFASFVKKHLTQLDANVHLQNSNNKDEEAYFYLKQLWTSTHNDKTITESMNARCTIVCGSMRTQFLSEKGRKDWNDESNFDSPFCFVITFFGMGLVEPCLKQGNYPFLLLRHLFLSTFCASVSPLGHTTFSPCVAIFILSIICIIFTVTTPDVIIFKIHHSNCRSDQFCNSSITIGFAWPRNAIAGTKSSNTFLWKQSTGHYDLEHVFINYLANN